MAAGEQKEIDPFDCLQGMLSKEFGVAVGTTMFATALKLFMRAAASASYSILHRYTCAIQVELFPSSDVGQ